MSEKIQKGRENVWNSWTLSRRDIRSGSYAAGKNESGAFCPYTSGGELCVKGAANQDNFLFKTADAFCMMENMVLQATELGIASCIVSRGYETFDSEVGQKLMREWEVPASYACQGFVILGYIDGAQPHGKPRKPGRIKIIE
ncbi:nitroreductase family protein [Roseburia hominis]|uniref:nitroreductase family protein n=1 Tax=Roseburia hominis TaxID=301301 RepID=UPI002ED02467